MNVMFTDINAPLSITTFFCVCVIYDRVSIDRAAEEPTVNDLFPISPTISLSPDIQLLYVRSGIDREKGNLKSIFSSKSRLREHETRARV